MLQTETDLIEAYGLCPKFEAMMLWLVLRRRLISVGFDLHITTSTTSICSPTPSLCQAKER